MWFLSFADDPERPSAPAPRPQSDASPAGAGTAQAGEPAEDEEDEEEMLTVGAEINEVLQLMLPWMTSLLFHLGIIVLALFIVWAYISMEEEEDEIIPSARLSANPGGQLAKTSDMSLAATQNIRQVQAEDVAQDEAMDNLTSDTENALELVGLAGGGGGGKMAPFGTTVGTGQGMGAKFFGSGGNATEIIYVVDASGSLIDTLPFVIKELKRSVGELVEAQQFTVIFFQNGAAIEVPPPGWKQATSEIKRRVADWVTLANGNIIPRGSTNPIAALKLAMRYQPQLVFILSDNITGRGRYEVDRQELLAMLDQANPDRNMKINTIQFLYPDPLNTLKTIASEHGGIYKFVSEEDLGLQ